MKKIIYFSISIILTLNCYRDFSEMPVPDQERPLTVLEKKLTNATEKFGLKLFQEMSKASPDSNIFISPLSISMALAMTYNGAAGTTEEAMRQTLEFGDMSKIQINESFNSLIGLFAQLDPRVQFDLANSIWSKQGFVVEPDFIDLNKKYFDALVQELDFSAPGAVDIINGWISNNTNHKIENMIDRIPPSAVMYLINAIYFNGTWMYEFDKNNTIDDLFHTQTGSDVQIKMMRISGKFYYLENEQFQVIDLLYGSGKYGMTLFLPKSGRSIDTLITSLSTEQVTDWMNSLVENAGILNLPKFKIEFKTELNKVLTTLGMGVAFSGGANFKNINKDGGLFISRVLHNSFLEVDEEGTEAAAATVVEIVKSAAPQGFIMRVNRPFFFFIRERKNNIILFAGKITNPTI